MPSLDELHQLEKREKREFIMWNVDMAYETGQQSYIDSALRLAMGFVSDQRVVNAISKASAKCPDSPVNKRFIETWKTIKTSTSVSK